MNISERLSPSQVSRINRLQLSRNRKQQVKPKNDTDLVYGPLIFLLCGILLLITGAILIVETRWNPGTELYTKLPANLNEQQASITIYADR